MLCRDLGLVKRLRVDQIAHGFGLGQIDAAVEKRAHGELAGLGKPRAGRDAKLHDVSQYNRRAVRRDLDDVVGGVRVRFGEVSDHHFVDAGGKGRA